MAFLYKQYYGKLQSALTIIQRHKSTIPAIKFACPYKACTCPQVLPVLPQIKYLIMNFKFAYVLKCVINFVAVKFEFVFMEGSIDQSTVGYKSVDAW